MQTREGLGALFSKCTPSSAGYISTLDLYRRHPAPFFVLLNCKCAGREVSAGRNRMEDTFR